MSDTKDVRHYMVHYSSIQDEDTCRYQGSDELLSIGAPFSKYFGFKKLGIHHETLPPGRRTSFPHAESAEEEFVFVIEGNPDARSKRQHLRPGKCA
jgi:uncharacterized cupin superfamily protein